MMLKLDVRRAVHGEPMPSSWPRKLPLPQLVVWGLFLAWAGWLAHGWVQDLRSSHTQARSAARERAVDVAAAANEAAAVDLFGKPVANNVVPTTVALDIKLKGVFASKGDVAGAIVNTGGKDQFVELGKEIGPGVILGAVHPEYIVIKRGGLAQRVDLGRLQSGATASSRTVGPPPGAGRGERVPEVPPFPPQSIPSQGMPPTGVPPTESSPPTALPAAVSHAPGAGSLLFQYAAIV